MRKLRKYRSVFAKKPISFHSFRLSDLSDSVVKKIQRELLSIRFLLHKTLPQSILTVLTRKREHTFYTQVRKLPHGIVITIFPIGNFEGPF